jgi:hypothetical protein
MTNDSIKILIPPLKGVGGCEVKTEARSKISELRYLPDWQNTKIKLSLSSILFVQSLETHQGVTVTVRRRSTPKE